MRGMNRQQQGAFSYVSIEERIPAGRVGTAEDLLGTVIFLCSAASDYLTGQIVYVDGGWLAS